jgi:hypothetical protein
MSSFPNVPTSNIFNSSDYNILDTGLTIEQANRLYLSLGGGVVTGNISTSNLSATSTVSAPIINSSQYLLSGSPINFSAITGVVNGTATANKALILDGSLEIGTLNAITSNNYYGNNASIQLITNDINTSAINCNAPMFYALSTNNTGTYQTYQEWSNTIETPITTQLKINNSNVQFGNTSNHALIFLTNNSQKMVLNAGGNLSIGNTNNTYKLDITGTTISDVLRVRGSAVEFLMDAITGVGGTDAGLRIYPSTQGSLTYSHMSFFNVARTVNVACIATNANQNCLHARVQSGDQSINIGNTGFISGLNAIFRDAVMITANSLTNSSNYTPNAKLTITANTEFTTGSLNKALIIQNPNFVNKFSIDIGNANYAPLWMGTTTASDVYIGAGNTTAFTISNSTRYVNIGTEDIARVPLDIRTTNTYTFNSGGLFTAYRLRTDSGVTESSTSAVTYNVSALFQGYIGCTAMAMTSDIRLKTNIKPVPFDRIKALYDLNIVEYNWKNKLNENSEVGLIAQDVAKTGLFDLISIFKNDELKEGTDKILEPEGQQFNVDYSRISVYNMRMIQELMKKIKLLENKLKI